MKYRDANYFNVNDVYLFEGLKMFTSKVEIDNGKIFTVKSDDRPQYKATTIKCVKHNSDECYGTKKQRTIKRSI